MASPWLSRRVHSGCGCVVGGGVQVDTQLLGVRSTSPAGEAVSGRARSPDPRGRPSAPAGSVRFQGWVLEILQKAARDARAAHALLRDCSLLTWVLHALEGR